MDKRPISCRNGNFLGGVVPDETDQLVFGIRLAQVVVDAQLFGVVAVLFGNP